MAEFEFNATTVEPGSPMNFDVVPAGKYTAIIVGSEMRDTTTSVGKYLWLEFDIIDEGPMKNRKLWDRLNLVNSNPKTVEIAKKTLSAICHATNTMQLKNTEQLHGIPILLTVRVKPAGPDKGGTYREAQNEIRGYESAGQSASARVAPAVASQARTAPPWKRAGAAAS